MISLPNLQKSGHFKTLSLNQWEVLFEQWDFDSNLYIIVSWELEVDTKIHSIAGEYKNIWVLHAWEILWEASMSRNEQKQARVSSLWKTTLLYIDGKVGFLKFLKEYPELWYQLLLSIIEITNRRLLSANQETRANHEVNLAIWEIKTITTKAIGKLLEKFKTILKVDQIVFLEKNIVMDEYFKLKYISPSKKELWNTIIKFSKGIFSLDVLREESIELKQELLFSPLHLWDKEYGFLVIWRDKKKFERWEEKLLQNTASSFVGIIHRKEVLDEQESKKLLWASRKYYQQ